ncbi:MAG: L,D-transpeptidase, partial [Anaerolineales bacterium]|nr:L,D-transpeptidase [Anaerolineales bacterium]
YSTQMVNNVEWVLIAPDEWLEARLVALLDPRYSPPEGVTGKRWIDINLYEQTLGVYEDNQLVYATLITSGVEPFWTRPGLFQIYQKLEETTMSGSFEADRSDYYYLEAVPWTMYFDQARALHGAYWHTYFGYPGSHGCVNLSIGDARWLFDWAADGDWVYVYDPSGQTPTDPALFGAGAP